MNTMFSFTLLLMVAATLAAICAAFVKARAAPRLVLASVRRPPGASRIPPPALVFEEKFGAPHCQAYTASLCARSSRWRSSVFDGGKSVPDSKKGRDRERRTARTSSPTNGSGGGTPHEAITFGDDPIVTDGEPVDDMAGPQLARVRPPYRLQRRLYGELVKIFLDAGNRDQALILKTAIKKRLPGHRGLIDAAYHEAERSVFYIA